LVPQTDALARVSGWSIASYTALFALVHVLRAARWHWLLKPIGEVALRRIVNVSFVGFAAIVLLPLRAGEVVRPMMIRKDTQVSGWAAAGTIAAERVLDGLLVSLLLLGGLLLSTPLDPLPDQIGDLPVPARLVPGAAYTALVLFGCAFMAMGLFYARRSAARRLVALSVGKLSPRLAAWLAARVEALADGLRFLPRPALAWPFVALSLAYWLLNALATYQLGVACGLAGMSYAIACVSMGVLALGILLPNAPGYFGAFQISVYASLALYFSASQVQSAGAAFVFVQYAVQTVVTLGAGALGLLAERRRQPRASDPSTTQLEPDLSQASPDGP